MKIAITTGPLLHHRYAVRKLTRAFPESVVLVIVQTNLYGNQGEKAGKSSASHAQPRRRAPFSAVLFGAQSLFWRLIRMLAYGPASLRFPRQVPVVFTDDINDEKNAALLREHRCDLFIMLGGKIVKDHILAAVNGNAINVHNGYSPYYKGSQTLFWPIVEGRTDRVGTTIHWTAPVVDSGAIIHRVLLNPNQYPHKELLFIASIKKSIRALLTIIGMYTAGMTLPHIPDEERVEKIYFAKEWTQDTERNLALELRRNFFKNRI